MVVASVHKRSAVRGTHAMVVGIHRGAVRPGSSGVREQPTSAEGNRAAVENSLQDAKRGTLTRRPGD